jgi:hypothetical protein
VANPNPKNALHHFFVNTPKTQGPRPKAQGPRPNAQGPRTFQPENQKNTLFPTMVAQSVLVAKSILRPHAYACPSWVIVNQVAGRTEPQFEIDSARHPTPKYCVTFGLVSQQKIPSVLVLQHRGRPSCWLSASVSNLTQRDAYEIPNPNRTRTRTLSRN